jgi:hypothetical protein
MRIICLHRMVTFTAPNAHICSRELSNNFLSTNQDLCSAPVVYRTCRRFLKRRGHAVSQDPLTSSQNPSWSSESVQRSEDLARLARMIRNIPNSPLAVKQEQQQQQQQQQQQYDGEEGGEDADSDDDDHADNDKSRREFGVVVQHVQGGRLQQRQHRPSQRKRRSRSRSSYSTHSPLPSIDEETKEGEEEEVEHKQEEAEQ